MKRLLMVGIIFLFCRNTAFAQFDSGSTGADGAFSPASDIVVVLPTDGILNYTTVDIPSGVTVTFQKNQDNTPVYILASGDVNITGTISVNGSSGASTDVGKGGPGGFDGGFAAGTSAAGGRGQGPGGGTGGGLGGGGGGYSTGGGSGSGAPGGGIYGSERLLPLIGGSGGGGGGGDTRRNGAGGGGGILIASSGTINVIGSITANGGQGSQCLGG